MSKSKLKLRVKRVKRFFFHNSNLILYLFRKKSLLTHNSTNKKAIHKILLKIFVSQSWGGFVKLEKLSTVIPKQVRNDKIISSLEIRKAFWSNDFFLKIPAN